MIRINLLGVERKARKAVAVDPAQRVAIVCTLLLALTAAGIGYWYWSLREQSVRVDADLAAAQQEATRLRSLLADVQRFEAQRAQLQQRVSLIEQLRRGQSAPVQLLDHVSRSLPDMLWLTSLEQSGTTLTIEGRSTTLIALSDFVGNLGNSVLVRKPIEIVNSEVENAAAGQAPGTDLIRFTVKAQLAETGGGTAPAGAPGGRP